MGKAGQTQNWPYGNAPAMRTHSVSVNSVCPAFFKDFHTESRIPSGGIGVFHYRSLIGVKVSHLYQELFRHRRDLPQS